MFWNWNLFFKCQPYLLKVKPNFFKQVFIVKFQFSCLSSQREEINEIMHTWKPNFSSTYLFFLLSSWQWLLRQEHWGMKKVHDWKKLALPTYINVHSIFQLMKLHTNALQETHPQGTKYCITEVCIIVLKISFLVHKWQFWHKCGKHKWTCSFS